MGSKSDYLELKALDAILGPGFTPPATVYWGLFSVSPSDTGGGTELTSGSAPGYTRLAATNNATNFPAATSVSGVGTKAVGADQTFPANSSGSAWPAVIAFGLFDASTAGNLLIWGGVTSLAIAAGAAFVIPNGTVIWTED